MPSGCHSEKMLCYLFINSCLGMILISCDGRPAVTLVCSASTATRTLFGWPRACFPRKWSWRIRLQSPSAVYGLEPPMVRSRGRSTIFCGLLIPQYRIISHHPFLVDCIVVCKLQKLYHDGFTILILHEKIKTNQKGLSW